MKLHHFCALKKSTPIYFSRPKTYGSKQDIMLDPVDYSIMIAAWIRIMESCPPRNGPFDKCLQYFSVLYISKHVVVPDLFVPCHPSPNLFPVFPVFPVFTVSSADN